MQLKHLPYTLIFVPLLGTCMEAESVNDHQWNEVLPYLDIKYFQESWPSLFATANSTLCSQHLQIYLDQINVSYWATKSEYFSCTLNIRTVFLKLSAVVDHFTGGRRT
jgi:hypothetical protein